MQKLLLLSICAALIFSLAACQGGDTNGASGSSSQKEGTPTAPSEETINFDTPPKQTSAVIDAMLSAYSAKEFVAGEVSEDDLRLILETGLKAPSARNLQPWHFIVISEGDLLEQVLREPPAGSVAIVIAGSTEDAEGLNVDFDCGLATQNMYIAAQSLGYGAHIYMGGVSELNEDLRDEAGIPDGYDAIMILLVATQSPDVDAVASASIRNPLEEMVTFH